VILINLGDEAFVVARGDRIAQLIIAPVSAVAFTKREVLDATVRGENGFGSTGHKA
jgi:dUTP pyrophosphatase